MANFELANQLSILITARNPSWSQQTAITDWPKTMGDGVYLQNSPRSRLTVAVRANMGQRVSSTTITNFVAGAVYTVTINGTACAFTDTSGNSYDTIDGLAVRVNTLLSATVTAVATDTTGDGNFDTVVVTSDTSTSYYIDIGATGGAVLACVADPESCKVDIFWNMKQTTSTAPATWYRDEMTATNSLTPSGREWSFDTGGKLNGYASISAIAGHVSDGGSVTYTSPVVHWGPSVSE